MHYDGIPHECPSLILIDSSPGRGSPFREAQGWGSVILHGQVGCLVSSGALRSEGFPSRWRMLALGCSVQYTAQLARYLLAVVRMRSEMAGVWTASRYLEVFWRCAECEVPTSANLNLYGVLLGIVSMKNCLGFAGNRSSSFRCVLGFPAEFKRKASVLGSCWRHHGDVLVMGGECQDEFIHRHKCFFGWRTDECHLFVV